MEVRHDRVTFRWSEVRDLLPERISHYGYVVGEIIGENSLQFKVGSAEIQFVCHERDISVVVVPPKTETFESLSKLVAECESILLEATKNGVFRDLEIAVTVATQLTPYFLRLIRRELDRSGLEQRISQIEAKLKQNK